MALSQSLVGRAYPPTEPYQVARQKIREFADAIGATDAAYRDPAAAAALGHPDVIAPPTFPVAVIVAGNRFLIDDPDLIPNYDRVVHGDQRFRYVRPVRAGDRLICTAVVEEVTSRAGHDFITMRTEVTTDAGELVVTVWAKLVVRGEDG